MDPPPEVVACPQMLPYSFAPKGVRPGKCHHSCQISIYQRTENLFTTATAITAV